MLKNATNQKEKNVIYQKMQYLAHRLLQKYQLKAEDIIFILNILLEEIFNKEPNVLNINAPVYVVGGIKGNFDDFLSVFDIGGPLPYSTYLFLGNITGSKGSSLNTILLLFVYKYLYKSNIFIIQGYNEKILKEKTADEDVQNSIPVVSQDIKLKLNEEIIQLYDLQDAKRIWEYFATIFNNLPIAAIISQIFFCADSFFQFPDKDLSVEIIRKIDRTSYTEHDLLTSRKKDFLEQNKFVFLITGENKYHQRNEFSKDHYQLFSAPHEVNSNEYCYIIEIDENKVPREIRMRPMTNKIDELYTLPNMSIIF